MKLPILFLIAASASAQRNAIDWPFVGNDAQRTGWEKSDSSITKDNIKDFRLVMKMSLDPKVKGSRSISPPVVLGRLISYRVSRNWHLSKAPTIRCGHLMPT